ncbi:right-handed parallel beta-helix repeat-containing protein, partial [Sphaerisporangium melleum]
MGVIVTRRRAGVLLALATASGLALAGGIANGVSATAAPNSARAALMAGPNDLVGWATQGGGTTGGSGNPITVNSASALTSALSSSNPAIIRVSGTINCSGMLKVTSNKSVIGNSGATIAGCGLNVNKASNVIIRNLTFRNWNDDAINVQYSTRVWIGNNTLSNGYDGAIDIKRASDYVTVSWNRISSHDKTMLLGHSDDNGAED